MCNYPKTQLDFFRILAHCAICVLYYVLHWKFYLKISFGPYFSNLFHFWKKTSSQLPISYFTRQNFSVENKLFQLKFKILFQGSEVLRCLGYIRAYLLVALRMIFPKPYYVKVSYLPLQTSSSGKPIPVSEKEPRLKCVFQKLPQ